MFYQSSIANIVRLSQTVSGIAIKAAWLPLALVVIPSAAFAVEKEKSLPTIEIHFEVLDKFTHSQPENIPYGYRYGQVVEKPATTVQSKPQPKQEEKLAKSPVSSEQQAPKSKPVKKAKQEVAPAKPKASPKPLADLKMAESLPEISLPEASKPEVETPKPEIVKKPVEAKPVPAPKPIPAVKEPKVAKQKPEPKETKAQAFAPEPKIRELTTPPVAEKKPEPQPVIAAVPEPKMPELPTPPVAEKKPEPQPVIAAVPEPKMPELPAPPVAEKKAEPQPVIAVVPEPKMPELPTPPVAEKKAPKVIDNKSPSVSITPMPLPPTPESEFASALNAPAPETVKVPEIVKEPEASPAPETAPVPEVKPEAKPVDDGTPKEAPAKSFGGSPMLSIKFISTETNLPLSVEADLKNLAASIKKNNERVSLVAYASESADQSTTARRVSLSRVLAVRAFLIEQGVDKLNINVHAEGSKNPGGDPDRVDIFSSDSKLK